MPFPTIGGLAGLCPAASGLLAAPLQALLPAACPVCGGRCPAGESLCAACTSRLDLPAGGLRGEAPLRWWAAGFYAGELRGLLLGLRRRPRPRVMRGLVRSIGAPEVSGSLRPWLVPIPSWKRQGNPLPPLLCQCLADQLHLPRSDLLLRRHPVLGQHHLGRGLRFANQQGSFACRRTPRTGEARRRPLLLVDDILTSGATALAASAALREGGWRVQGLLCLARTPERWPLRDLSWKGRRGDGPG